MNILGVVVARGGSKGLPKKNLLKLGNKSLVEIAIESATKSKLLNKVIVSTDDKEIYEIAKISRADVPFLRPKRLATDKSSVFDVLKHCVKWLIDNQNWTADIVVLLQSTTPFRKPDHIDNVIKLLIKNNTNSAMTVVKPDYPPHWMLTMDKKLLLKRLIDDDKVYHRRQDTPKVFQPAGSVYAIKRDALFNLAGNFPQADTLGFEISQDEAVNIDNLIQYKLAEALWDNNNE
jgi:N-acylneuraminate cytidylyltransferase/CMP-N,N'-diacetyllegionaminic acid synthase